MNKRSYDFDITKLEKSKISALLNDDFNKENKISFKGTFKGVSLLKLNNVF